MLLKKYKILYVEDSRVFTNHFVKSFSNHFKEILTAPNGEVGLQMYKMHKPEIVVTDINMPVMDGLEMSEEIKKINKNQAIVLLTELTHNETLRRAIEIGVKSFVSKPVTQENLFKVLSDLVEDLQAYRDAKRVREIEQNNAKIKLLLDLMYEIGHHWRQPLTRIMAISSGYGFKKENNLYTTEDELKDMDLISNEVEKLTKMLRDIEDIDLNSLSIDEIISKIKISKPIYTNNSCKENIIRVS